ncbi:uncharacterized protein LOC123473819 isoform X1 [Daphnia magna]|uniref:uncharacterized protein LOC123473819 isoform X1 n=1 Tax=Daphnia magna TaxID=35525 RepID=UPI001E1BB201|nr:uncharacterized protein LOC123473819 isoform X1 [Daphnia magna]
MSVQQSQNCAFLCPLFVNLFLRLANLFSFSSPFFIQFWSDQVFVCDSSIGDVITIINSIKVTSVKWISENRIAVSSLYGTTKIFEMEENNLTTTRLVKEFTISIKYCDYLEWSERTQYLASGSEKLINILSMDHDRPIYNLEQEEEEDKRFAWRLCTGNGEEEGGIEMARKSAKNFTFAFCSMKGVFIWNPLENEQQPRRLSHEKYIEMVAFSSDGRFLAAVGPENLMIWSTEDWVQIYKVNKRFGDPTNISFFTTKSTNLYENKLIVNYGYEGSSLFEFAFEESNISDSTIEISTKNDDEDDDEDVDADREDISPPKRLKGSFP